MLTIRKIGSSEGAVKYYAEYAQEKGESAGQFRAVSGALGLDGKTVAADVMEKLLTGYAPDGETPLCNKPGEGHVPGWDLTFSPPKSVSIAWSNADDSLRSEMELAQERAVGAALSFVEREAGFVRLGAGGVDVVRADLLFSLFQHSSNRAEEPQLHTHAILYNVARVRKDDIPGGSREKGEMWRTLHPRPIYRAYMAAGAIYKAELAHEMKRLGFGTSRTKDSFEIDGIPKEVCDAQSSRSKQIEEILRAKGLTRAQATAQAREIIALESRSEKERITRDFDRWKDENTKAGFGPKEQEALRGEGIDRTTASDQEQEGTRATDALSGLSKQESTFSVYNLYRAVAEAAIGEQGADVVGRVAALAKGSPDMIHVGANPDKEERYSTRDIYNVEREIMQIVKDRKGEDRHPIGKRAVEAAIAATPKMNLGQKAALRHVALGKDGVTFITGDAGTGKSFLMGVAKEVYEKNGHTLIGLSFTNKAAQNLETGSGIKSRSVDSFLLAYRGNPDILPQKAVLVLDEAAMLDSRKTLALLRIAKEAGAKVIALGDEKQIQPITAGQAFGTLGRQFGSKRLTEVVRQKDRWEGAALRDLAEGNTLRGLDAFIQRDGISITSTRNDSRAAIIDEWRRETERTGGKAPLMVASTNAEVTTLNLMARALLVESGRVGAGIEIETAHGTYSFAKGDQIVFTSNYKKKGILNSALAKIEKINPKTKALTIRTESGQRVRFSPKTMNGFRHGYAITAHKSQGSTVGRVLVMVDSANMDREKFYVAMSRGRERSMAFADIATVGDLTYEERQKIKERVKNDPKLDRAEEEAKVHVRHLAGLIGNSHEKDTTHDYEKARRAFAKGHDLARPAGQVLVDLRTGLSRALERIADGFRSLRDHYDRSADGKEQGPAVERDRGDQELER